MTREEYERIFRKALMANHDIELARNLTMWAKNEYIKLFAHSQIHEAKAHLLAIEDRVIREIAVSGLDW